MGFPPVANPDLRPSRSQIDALLVGIASPITRRALLDAFERHGLLVEACIGNKACGGGLVAGEGCAKRQWGQRDHLASDRSSRHTSRMPETPTQSDLEKAHLILSEFGLLIGPAGEMSDVIARAVAAGIALGRREALAEKRRNRG
jgi:hypothetical protein